MLTVVVFFLGASLVLYCVFGGADFGAGILECFRSHHHKEAQEKLVNQALGPVWEANHVWLIVAIVILYSGFPDAAYLLTTAFHLPLTMLLVGITLRGCAFTFRHYDAVKDRSHHYYTAFFASSSLLTPMTLGMIAGGLMTGLVEREPTRYYDAFVAPWLNPFSFAVGFFVTALFCYLAAVYLAGETTQAALRRFYRRRALLANAVAIGTGTLVFATAAAMGLPLVQDFFRHPSATATMIAATALVPCTHWLLSKNSVQTARIAAATQVSLVLIGWFFLQYPVLVQTKTGPVTIASAAAPELSLYYLASALIGGSALIFPALAYLFWVFKLQSKPKGVA